MTLECFRCAPLKTPGVNLVATGRTHVKAAAFRAEPLTRVELECLDCKYRFWSALPAARALLEQQQEATACQHVTSN